jgi:hypothetical protein
VVGVDDGRGGVGLINVTWIAQAFVPLACLSSTFTSILSRPCTLNGSWQFTGHCGKAGGRSISIPLVARALSHIRLSSLQHQTTRPERLYHFPDNTRFSILLPTRPPRPQFSLEKKKIMSPKERGPRQLTEATDDFYRRPRRGNLVAPARQPTTVETGAQIARLRGDSYRPLNRDNPDVPSGFVGRGRRSGPAAPAPPSNAVRPRTYAEKPWLLTTAPWDEDDNDDDYDDDEDPHASLARLLAEPRPQPVPVRPLTIPALRKTREETKRKGGERHGWAIMASQERLRTAPGGDHAAKDAAGVTAPVQQPVAVKTGEQAVKPFA